MDEQCASLSLPDTSGLAHLGAGFSLELGELLHGEVCGWVCPTLQQVRATSSFGHGHGHCHGHGHGHSLSLSSGTSPSGHAWRLLADLTRAELQGNWEPTDQEDSLACGSTTASAAISRQPLAAATAARATEAAASVIDAESGRYGFHQFCPVCSSEIFANACAGDEHDLPSPSIPFSFKTV